MSKHFNLILFCALLAGCSFSGPLMAVQNQWRIDTQEPDAYARKMALRQPAYQDLTAKMAVRADALFLKDHRPYPLLALDVPGVGTKLQINDPSVLGPLLVFVEGASGTAVHQVPEGLYFVKNHGPDKTEPVLFGAYAEDIPRLLRVLRDAAAAVESQKDFEVPEAGFWRDHFCVRSPRSAAEFSVRIADGLVSSMRLLDPDGKVRLKVRYEEYAYFPVGTSSQDRYLWPQRFAVQIPGHSATLRFETLWVRPDRSPPPPPEVFAISPPPGLIVLPLTRWLESY